MWKKHSILPVRAGDARGITQNEKAARQQGDLFFSRENSSNRGFKIRRNFLPKSYGPKKEGVKQFLANKCLCFQ
jgi:hypothetical protein